MAADTPFEFDRHRTLLDQRMGRNDTVTLIDDPPFEDLFCPIISVDDHLLEPASLFDGRVPRRLAHSVPRQVTDDEALPYWLIDGARIPIILNNGAVSRPMREWKGAQPSRYEDFRRGVWDSRERLEDMDRSGIWASLCFGSVVWGFAGWRFSRMADPAVGFACVQAYNDWVVEEWCGAAPDRYIPCQLTWLADTALAAQEVRRNADRGVRAVSFSENPEALGFPSIYNQYWDPFFRACEETGTIINLHVGSDGRTNMVSSESPPEVLVALFPISAQRTLVDWIYSRVPLRFPGLHIALSEGGASWVPMILERLARAFRQLDASMVWTAADPDPVEVARRNFHFASLEDPSAFRLLDLIGEENIMVESDYPHGDSTWPTTQALLRSTMSHLTPSTIRRICFENAAALYQHPLPPNELVAKSDVGVLEA